MNMEKSKTFSERKSLVSEEEQPYKLPDIIWVGHEKPGSIGVDDIRDQLV